MRNRHLFSLPRRQPSTRYFPPVHLQEIFCPFGTQISKTR